MRIFFIVDEFPFFLPEYLDETIHGLKEKHTVVGITPLVTPKGHKTLYSYLTSQLIKLGPKSVLSLSYEAAKLKLNKYLFDLKFSKNPATIYQVAKKNKIRIINTTNVNDKQYLKILKKLNIDIIVSSCSQIFKKDILNLPKVACINRHSAFLPSYGGLFPVFYAMINNEKFTGATVHRMITGIDKGSIISQIKVPIKKNDSMFYLYSETYKKSVLATTDAIEKLEKNKKFYLKPEAEESYYSFPQDKHWKIFWKRKKRII